MRSTVTVWFSEEFSSIDSKRVIISNAFNDREVKRLEDEDSNNTRTFNTTRF